MLPLTAAIAIIVAATGLFVASLRSNSGLRIGAWFIASVCVALSPCAVQLGSHWRLPISLIAIGVLVKLFDALRSSQQGVQSRSALWFANFFWLMLRHPPPDRSRSDDWIRLAQLSVETAAASWLLCGVFQLDWQVLSFFLEHCAKATATFFVVVASTELGAVAWRLVGGKALDPMRAPLTAVSPADFWLRWNRPAQSFLHHYVFRVAGGRRRLILATLATFLISGLIHEYVFGIASGRVQGDQLLFFLIQGVGVLATQHCRASGWLRSAGQAATIAFNLVTSMLFFRSVDDVLPFYVLRD